MKRRGQGNLRITKNITLAGLLISLAEGPSLPDTCSQQFASITSPSADATLVVCSELACLPINKLPLAADPRGPKITRELFHCTQLGVPLVFDSRATSGPDKSWSPELL
ncbi:hypothetical protein MFRU_004g01570 [Monilinia fructicola]|nr:hypothetical protein MFRU_004g01570 [Monilinia fructicola]